MKREIQSKKNDREKGWRDEDEEMREEKKSWCQKRAFRSYTEGIESEGGFWLQGDEKL